MRTIIIPSTDEDEDGKVMSPLPLSQSIDLLLGSKSSFTTEWTDSVPTIMNSSCGSPRIASCSGCTNASMASTSSSDSTENVHDRQRCFNREIANLAGELIVLRTALEVSNLRRGPSLNRMLDLKVFPGAKLFLEKAINSLVEALMDTLW